MNVLTILTDAATCVVPAASPLGLRLVTAAAKFDGS